VRSSRQQWLGQVLGLKPHWQEQEPLHKLVLQEQEQEHRLVLQELHNKPQVRVHCSVQIVV
jgi:hypothetical protein